MVETFDWQSIGILLTQRLSYIFSQEKYYWWYRVCSHTEKYLFLPSFNEDYIMFGTYGNSDILKPITLCLAVPKSQLKELLKFTDNQLMNWITYSSIKDT